MSGRAAGRGRGRGDRRRSTEPPTPGRGLGRGISSLISQKPGGSPIMQQTGVNVDQRSGVTSEERETNGLVSPVTACADEASSVAESSSCDTLLISNLPENADGFVMEMYFESPKSGGCDGAIKKIHFVEPKVAQVQFKDPQVAASILAKQDHILEGSQLIVQYYSAESDDVVPTIPETESITDTLEVTNLPHNVSIDTLQLYFESRKSGGCEDGVKEVTFVESGVARVQLTDAKVAANILEKSMHTFSGATLEVRPFEPPVEDSTPNDTLEIRNLPQECDKEEIQLYFENPKAGGRPGGVKNIQIIGNGVVQVQFIDDQTAAGVLSKKDHTFNGAKLQVGYYDSSCSEESLLNDTLEISNLPPDTHKDTLELYLESRRSGGCDGGVKNIMFVSPGVARVQFNSETIAENILKKSSHTFQGSTLEVKVYTHCVEAELEEMPLDTLEVSNLPSNVTKEVLELYFESPKSGGQGGAVQDVSFASPGVAHVKLSDPETADVIVKRVHKFQNVEFQVRFLQESTCKPADTLKVSGLPEGTSKYLLELYFESPRSGGCEGGIKSISFHGPTTACIQFTSDEIAAGILAKEEHKLKGSIIQVCYFEDSEDKAETDQLRDTLEVSNLPADVSEELLEFYFESPKSGGCEGAVKSVTIIGPGIAQVQFSTDKIAAEVMAKTPQMLKGVELMMKYSDCNQVLSSSEVSEDILEVSNLPEQISKEFLELYFESPKSGGCSDGVKNVTLLRPGVAKVLFSSSDIAAKVVAKDEHKVGGSQVQVKYAKLSDEQDVMQEGSECGSTLEVSNIPGNVEGNYLQMYFENPKSGGCADCVKDITIVEPGIAHVQLTDAAVAASICSRKEHKFQQTELQVKYLPTPSPVAYEMDKLILENVPEGIEEDFLILFIVNCLGIVKDDFSITRSNDKVLLVLSREYSLAGLQTMIKNLQAKPIRRGAAALHVTLYEVCRSIQIHNITEYYDKEFILMYFESNSKQSGGGPIETIQMLGEGEVIITFWDYKVVSAILERSHPCFGQQVQVERKDSLHSSTVSRENISSVDIAVVPTIVKCISKHPEQLKELVKELHLELKFDDDNGKVICSSTIYTKAGWKEKATTTVGSYIESNYISTPDQWVPKDALPELYGHLSNQKGLEFEVSKDGTNLKIGGEKKVVQSFEVTLKDIFDRYTVDTADVKFDRDPETFHFLTQVKLPQISSQLTRIQVSKDPHIPSLTLRGMKKDVIQFQSELEKLGVHAKVNIELQPHILNYLRTQDGQYQLQNHLSQAKVQAALYVTSQGVQTLLCESVHVDAVKNIATYLATVLSVAQHKMPLSFESEQENYLQLCQTCEKQHHVKISHAGNVLVIAGMKPGVDSCSTELYKFILNSCTVEERIAVERGELRLLLSHMKAKWDTIAKNCEKSEFVVELTVPQLQPSDNESISEIQLRGERDCVKKVSSQISKLQGSICKQSEMIEQADIEFLTSENARTYLDGIEVREHVTIEVTVPISSPTPALAHAIDTTHFLKCQAKLSEMSNFYLYVGDISEFSGADVIVNAANIELKHIGGVALALLKKGGPIIQEESTRYVRSHGNLKPGDAWLTTKVGDLPCKALVHVVGPKWSGNNDRRESRILEDACMQALQKSSREQNFQSIAFPTVSAGVYGFPIDKCAVCMVKTILKFSKTPSNLKNIIVVIHTSKSSDADLFISALKQRLPPDSIQVNDEPTYMAQKHSTVSKAATMPAGASKSAKKKKTTKKSGGILPSGAILKVPPGVLDCIKLVKGSLLSVTADVYVNTTNNQLNLSSGAVSKALLNAAGQSLQDECTKKAPIKTGNVAITGPGKLPCKYVFHTVIPSYDGKASEKILKNSIHTCLKECSSRGMISIAIPSIGTGNLRFSNDIVARITIEEAITYLSSQKRGSLEFVHLVIFMDDTYKAFKKVLSSYGPQAALPAAADDNSDSDDDSNDDENDDSFPPPSMPLARVKKNRRLVGTRSTTLPSTASGISGCLTLDIENTMVHLINGDITDSTCDAIVNPTNPLMKLTGAGVAGAILKKGGQEQQNLCDALISIISNLDEGKVVYTKATGDLKSKYVFHICHEGRNVKKLSDVILACLNQAVKLHLTSIAFPAVGTGINGCSPRESAASLIQAIRTFASSSSLKLQQIHIILCEPRILQDFQDIFKNPEEAQPSMLQRAFNSLYSLVVGGSSKSSADPKIVPVAEDVSVCKQLEVNIYGETKTAVKQAHHKVISWIDEALSDREISNPYIRSLPETDEENLRKICKRLHVEIDIDRESSRIFIKGNRISVDKVHTAVTESLNQFEKNLDKREHAKHLYEVVRWIRKEPGDLEGEEYDEIDNFDIEMAHRKSQPRCTIGTPADMYYYTIDFASGKETDHKTGVISEVERIDVLKQLQEGMEGEKPSTWEKMPPNSSLHIVPVDSKSSEYTGVKQKFDVTMQGHYKQIIKIERIQNPALYLQFIGRKKEMDKHNPKGHQNERSLFHGTSVDACPKINQNGFNRSFAGIHATAFGKGVYFARDASYSASSTYSPSDANGFKYMYLVRALTGVFTRGNSSMIIPPYKDAANFKEYDSVVDRESNPSIFVIFYDALVYPDYLITFQL